MTYRPIGDCGIIGNMRTAALVAMDGAIDWFCYPRFDSPSVFASILDDEKGGHFRIAPVAEGVTYKQFYWPETNILTTRFLSGEGVGQVTDFMPLGLRGVPSDTNFIVRQVRAVRGQMTFRLECTPAFNYARDEHETRIVSDGACFHTPKLSLGLATEVPLESVPRGVGSEFQLGEGETAVFVLRGIESGGVPGTILGVAEAEQVFKRTADYWHRWLSQCTYRGRWREEVHRSALALKLLTYEPTGAIVAAPTCSLPESIGGERNWDYRYSWIRDSAFTLYGFLRIGFTREAEAFMQFLEKRCRELEPDGSLQIMYGIDGRHRLTEETLDHLSGYRNSRPVRIGNGAFDQLQLDIYGALLDAVYLYNKYGTPISYDLWTNLRRMINWVCENWQIKDEGIWEVRGGRQHFVYSKLMCWVALDRGVRLAEKRSFPAERTRWLQVRDQIYEEIMERGWNRERGAFVQAYDSDCLDASTLIMPLVFFLSPTDPRMLSTLDCINRSPAQGGLVSDSLVYRYNAAETDDGLDGKEGSFNMCSFWLVEALTRAGRVDQNRLDAARQMFEQMLGYANHLGLYAEETGHSGEALGNFPQAFTHLALISAAFNLDRTLGTRG